MKKLIPLLFLLLTTSSAFALSSQDPTGEIEAGLATKQDVVQEGSLGKVILGEDVVDETIGATQLAKAVKSVKYTVEMGTGTLTLPAGGYAEYFVYLTCTTEPYTQIAISEVDAGSQPIPDKAKIHITVEGAIPLYQIDIPNQQEIESGPKIISQSGSINYIYYTDRFKYNGSDSNTEYFSSIDLSPDGLVVGAEKSFTAAAGTSLEPSQMNGIVLHTAAGLSYFTAGDYVAGKVTTLEAKQTGEFNVEWFSNDASDQFVKSDGTLTTAGNSLATGGLAGDGFKIKRLAEHKWYVTNENGTCVDGGGAPGYTLVDQFGGASGDTDDASRYFAYSSALYISSSFVVTGNATITRINVKLTKSGTPFLDTTAYLYNIETGTSKPGVLAATSTNVINTTDITGTEYKTYLFAGYATATNGGTDGDGKYCLVLYGTGGAAGSYPYARYLSTATGAIYYDTDASGWSAFDTSAQITFQTYKDTP